MLYDNIKSHRKSEFHPPFKRHIFRKTTGGGQFDFPPYPAVLGLLPNSIFKVKKNVLNWNRT